VQPPSIINSDGWVNVDDLSDKVILYHIVTAEEARYVYEALRDVRVVSVIDVKGGVKKTTAAVHIALGLNRRFNASVMIGDCDQYHSVQDWKNVAERVGDTSGVQPDPWPENVTVISASGPNFHFDLVEAVKKHKPKYLVIDTPPNDEEAALRALLASDVMVTPTGPFPMDIRRIFYGIQVGAKAEKLRGAAISPLALLTGTKLGSNLYKAALKALIAKGIEFVPMPVRDLVGHAQAFGTSVPDLRDYDFIPETLGPKLDKIYEEKQRNG
jgi:hypothetical protein